MRVDSRIGEGISAAIRYAMGEGKDDDGKPKPRPGAGGAGAAAIGRAEVLEGFNLALTLQDSRLLGMSEEEYVEFARSQMEWNGRAETQGTKRKYIAQDCLHTSLSWAPGETPTKKQKIDAARKYLAAIGMATAQAIVIEHHDRKKDRKGQPRAAHLHIVASRVNPETGKVFKENHRGLRERHFAVEYEERMHIDHAWPIPKGHQWRHNQRKITLGENIDYDDLFDNLFKNKSVVTTYAVDMALAFGGHFGQGPTHEHHRRFVEHNKLIALSNWPGGPVAAYTTPDILKRERRVRGLAKKLHAQKGFEVPDSILDIVAKKFNLDDEQCASLRHLTRDNGFALQTGNAGTGKSHVICKAVKTAYEMMGRGYVGTAFTNNNVLDMQRAGLTKAYTLDALLTKLKFIKPDMPKAPFQRGDVVAVEEAAQVNIFHLDQLYKQAEKRGIKIILSGDPKQMSPVTCGEMFSVHAKKFGTSTLTKVWRNPGKQKSWDAMADGIKARGQQRKEAKWRVALDELRTRNQIHFFDTREEAIQGIAEQYEKDRAEHPEQSQLILGFTNEDVKDLTNAVIKLQTERGLRGAETTINTSKGPVGYALGDRIMLKDNHIEPKVKSKGFINGAIGTVIGSRVGSDGRNTLTVDLDRPEMAQKRVFEFTPGLNKEAGEYDTTRGIAGTNYAGQGKSIDRTYPLHNPVANSTGQYVGMTRDKKEVFVGVSREETSGYAGLAAQVSQGGPKRSASSYYEVEAPAPTALEPPAPAPQIPPVPSPPLAPEPEPEPNRTPEPTIALPSPEKPEASLPVSASNDDANPVEKIDMPEAEPEQMSVATDKIQPEAPPAEPPQAMPEPQSEPLEPHEPEQGPVHLEQPIPIQEEDVGLRETIHKVQETIEGWAEKANDWLDQPERREAPDRALGAGLVANVAGFFPEAAGWRDDVAKEIEARKQPPEPQPEPEEQLGANPLPEEPGLAPNASEEPQPEPESIHTPYYKDSLTVIGGATEPEPEHPPEPEPVPEPVPEPAQPPEPAPEVHEETIQAPNMPPPEPEPTAAAAHPEAPEPEPQPLPLPLPLPEEPIQQPLPLPEAPQREPIPVPIEPEPIPIPTAQEIPMPEIDDDDVWPNDPQEERFRAQMGWPGTNNGWPGVRPGGAPPPGMDGPTHEPNEARVGTGDLPDYTEATRRISWREMFTGFAGEQLTAPGVDPYWPKPKIEIRGDEPLPEPPTPGPIHQGIPEPMPSPDIPPNVFNIDPEPPPGLPAPRPALPSPEPEPDQGYGL